MSSLLKVTTDVLSYGQADLTSNVTGILPPANGGSANYTPSLVYVSANTGNDANAGTYDLPVKTMTKALMIGGVGASSIFCYDSSTFDEALVIPNNTFIYAPNCAFQTISTVGDCISSSGYFTIIATFIQSTTGLAMNITGGFPNISFINGFGTGDIHLSGGGTILMNIGGFSNTIDIAGGTSAIIQSDYPLTITGAGNVHSPWSNTLIPQGLTTWPSSITINPTVFNFFTLLSSTSHIWYSTTAQNSQTLQTGTNDYGIYTFSCAKGNYNLTVPCAVGTDRGILKILINGVLVTSIDLYDASVNNNLSQQLTVSLNNGDNTIQLNCNTKNGLSTGFSITLTENIILNKI